MTYHVKLEEFEGPLDLLLHLIKKNELDIYKISVAEIADQYLQYVEVMKSLNLDGVGEFLLMAATLAYHKSKMLLPEEADTADDDEEETFESLEELRRRLIEYQRYKEAGEDLYNRPMLHRDVFKVAGKVLDEPASEETNLPLRASLFDLIDAFREVLKRAPDEISHEVRQERIRLLDRIVEVLDVILARGRVRFEELFQGSPTRTMVVVTFLSILELVRLRIIHAYQTEPFGPIDLVPIAGAVDHKTLLKEGLRLGEF